MTTLREAAQPRVASVEHQTGLLGGWMRCATEDCD